MFAAIAASIRAWVGAVGIDAAVPELSTRFMGGTFTNAQEYNWNIKRNLQVEGLYQKFMTLTGYVSLQVPMYGAIFGGNGLKEYYPAMEEMFIRNYLQPTHLKELEKVYPYYGAQGVIDYVDDFIFDSRFGYHVDYLEREG